MPSLIAYYSRIPFLPSPHHPRSTINQDPSSPPRCNPAATAAASRLSVAAASLRPRGTSFHHPPTMHFPTPHPAARTSSFAEKAGPHLHTGATPAGRSTSLIVSPSLQTMMLHRFHPNPVSQLSSRPNLVHFPEKSLNFSAALLRKSNPTPTALLFLHFGLGSFSLK